MSTKYNYVYCEEGASQYDEYDFNDSKIVAAKYVPAIVAMDKGNPYIEALPYPRDEDQIIFDYTKILPTYNFDKVKDMSKHEKLLQIHTLRQIRFPLPFHSNLEFHLYNALITSYRERKPLTSNNKKVSYTAEDQKEETGTILVGDSSNSTNAGFSLIGYSGCGKSSAVKILLSHYPQVIMHDDGDGGRFPQIVYLVVNCVANSNFVALYESIGEAIDKAFGNIMPVYAWEIKKANGLGRKADKVRSYIEKFGIGIIIFDEIQLIDFTHTRENTFDSLLTLANRTKVAMAVIGTEDAYDKMFKELRTARRLGITINGNFYCDDKDYFALLVEQIFQYQWFDEPVELTEELVDTLFDVTKGIVDQLVGIYSNINFDYVFYDEHPVVDAAYVRKIADKYYPGIQAVLARMETFENREELSKKREAAELESQRLIDEAKQMVAAKNIMNDKTQLSVHMIDLKNVTANILNIYDEFSESQIQEAFHKVMKKKASAGKTEKEINRMVLEQLQKIPKRKGSSKKKAGPDIMQMKDFLGIQKDCVI